MPRRSLNWRTELGRRGECQETHDRDRSFLEHEGSRAAPCQLHDGWVPNFRDLRDGARIARTAVLAGLAIGFATDPTVPVDELKKLWVPGAQVLFGRARTRRSFSSA
jgi:hypothetical protein